jgi:hypothetical protein
VVVRTTTKRASARVMIMPTVRIAHSGNGWDPPVYWIACTPSIARAKIAAVATSVGASSSVVLCSTNWSRS